MNIRMFVTLAVLCVPILAQGPTPTPDHQRLAYWVGTWNGEWVGKENPFGFTAGTYPFTMKGEAFPGSFHVLCRYEWAATGPAGA